MSKKRNSYIGYRITRKVGAVVRDKTFKNPFEKVGKVPAYLYQKAISPIIHKTAFKTNGILGYKRGSAPIRGSIRYTILSIVYGLAAFALFSCLIRLMCVLF